MIEPHPENTSLKGTLSRAVSTVYMKAFEKGIDLSEEEFSDVLIPHDSRWTAEVFLNVLDNAVKYSDEGGKISIEAQPFEIYTRIQIKDNGIGISSEHVTDVCRRFFREERGNRTEGLGIGLYLTREILEKEQGYMKIRSEIDEGTEVSRYILNFIN